jgi:two-component system cell cycle response regulator CtrA
MNSSPARDFRDRQILKLRHRVEELEEEVITLRDELTNKDWVCPIEFDLAPSLRNALAALVKKELCTKAHLHVVSAHQGILTETSPKIVDVTICKLRAKLKPFGIKIHTHWGLGYSIGAVDRDRLKNWNTHERPENGIRTIDPD